MRGGIQSPFRYLPDLIKGDLDSLRDDVKKYYESQVRIPKLFLLLLSRNNCISSVFGN